MEEAPENVTYGRLPTSFSRFLAILLSYSPLYTMLIRQAGALLLVARAACGLRDSSPFFLLSTEAYDTLSSALGKCLCHEILLIFPLV